MAFYPLFALIAITLAGTAMFLWNVHRASHQRRWIELKQWLRNNNMRLADAPSESLTKLLPGVAWTRVIADEHATLAAGHDAAGTYHVLLIGTEQTFAPAALRPAGDDAPHPLFVTPDLRPYPNLLGGERFVPYGMTLRAAQALAASPIRGLLPADVGLLLTGTSAIVDFSKRQFDPLEFSRIFPLAQQITHHLPKG